MIGTKQAQETERLNAYASTVVVLLAALGFPVPDGPSLDSRFHSPDEPAVEEAVRETLLVTLAEMRRMTQSSPGDAKT